MKIAVLGGGNGAYAAAADLALAGHEVALWRRSGTHFAQVLESQTIALTDARGTREVRLSLATTDLARALDGAELVLRRRGGHGWLTPSPRDRRRAPARSRPDEL